MTSVVKRVTSNFSLIVPFFDAPNWGFAFERNMDIIDAVLSTTSSVGNIVGPWESNTAYGVDDRVVDMTDNTVWQCATAHTSGSGTFDQDRIAHPTYWDAVSQSVVVREEFVNGRDYFVGDFVYDTSEFLGGIVTSPFTGNVNLRNNINDIGVIFDLKALYGMFPSTPSDGDYIQWNNTLGVYEPRDSDYVRDEMKAVTYNSGQSLSSGEQTQARTNISAADVTTVVRHDVAQGLGASAQGQARANIEAGVLSGFRNKIINGAFSILQRGSSGVVASGATAWISDRWQIFNDTNVQISWAYSSSTANYAYPDYIAGYVEVFFANPPTSGDVTLFQRIEDVQILSGGKATATIYCNTNVSLTNTRMDIGQYFGLSGSTGQRVSGPIVPVTPTGDFIRRSVVLDVPSITGKTIGAGNYCSFEFIFSPRSAGSYYFTAASLVEGDASAEIDPFSPRHIQQELALCERYLECLYDPAYRSQLAGSDVFLTGVDSSAVNSFVASAKLDFKTTKRVVPTLTNLNEVLSSSAASRARVLSPDYLAISAGGNSVHAYISVADATKKAFAEAEL